jgi:hypothetical protein
MRNCLILGSGRSGTSMVAGTLAGAGYFMGERLWKPTDANPKGFFEDEEINAINEDLLARVLPSRPRLLGRWFFHDRPKWNQRWLARVPLDVAIPSPPDLTDRIRAQTGHRPFCFKDPRFCYTLPVWRPFLGDAVYLCVFRRPADTAASILKECDSARYLRRLTMDFDIALEVWTLMYAHVLRQRHEGEWLFVHYEQVLEGDGLQRIADFIGTRLDRDFPDRALRRSRSDRPVPAETSDLYDELCRIAGFVQ